MRQSRKCSGRKQSGIFARGNDSGYLNLKGIQTVRYGAGNDYFPAQFHHTDTDIASVNDVVDVSKALTLLAIGGTK